MKKKWLVPVVIAVLFVGILAVALLTNGKENVTTFQFGEEINVVEGVADITEHSIPFTLSEDDTYVVNVKWTAEKPGMISGVTLCDEADEILFFCTGDSVDAESTELELKAGEYYAKYLYFASEDAFDTFLDTVEANVCEELPYEYAENESFQMTYHFNINRVRSVEYNVGLIVGMLVGVGVGLLVVALMFKFVKIRKGSNFEYDERQQIARGNGFKYGYIVGLIYNGVLVLVSIAEIPVPVEQSVLMIAGILLSVLVCVVYCIRNDAYVSLNEHYGRLMIVFTILGIVNIMMGVMHIVHGTIIENGVLTFRCINLLCGVVIICVTATLFVHRKLQSGEEE